MAPMRSSFITAIFTYYPLFLTCSTTVLNIVILIIFNQNEFRKRPTIGYMRAMAVIDALMMYGWNLDQFFRLKYGFELDELTVLSCKLATYYNYVLTQSSAWLRVWMCIDRFFTLHQVRQRRALYWHRRVTALIVLTFVAIALINLHLPIFSCFAYNNGTRISSASRHYRLYPAWNHVTLIIYNILPFIFMLVFNSLIIRHLIIIKRTSSLRQSRVRHSSISISIVLSTFLFCIMTTPPGFMFAHFNSITRSKLFRELLLGILDSVKYTYHALSFLVYFVTLAEFRHEFFRLLRCSGVQKTALARVIARVRGHSRRYETEPSRIATVMNL